MRDIVPSAAVAKLLPAAFGPAAGAAACLLPLTLRVLGLKILLMPAPILSSMPPELPPDAISAAPRAIFLKSLATALLPLSIFMPAAVAPGFLSPAPAIGVNAFGAASAPGATVLTLRAVPVGAGLPCFAFAAAIAARVCGPIIPSAVTPNFFCSATVLSKSLVFAAVAFTFALGAGAAGLGAFTTLAAALVAAIA